MLGWGWGGAGLGWAGLGVQNRGQAQLGSALLIFDNTQYANDKLEEMMNRKGLEFNTDKSNFLIIGSKKEQNRIQKSIDENPLTLCNEEMKQVKALKYLGDFLMADLAASVHETVQKRISIATLTIYEIRAVVEDRRAKCIGGVNIGINIFLSSVIPMVLFNCETWSCIPKKTYKSLNEFFCRFFRVLFQIGAGAPIPNFFWQVGMFLPENLILQRKINFIHHLATLQEGSLAKEVYMIQKENSLGGIVRETKEHVDRIGDPVVMSKHSWKKKVLQYMKEKNKNDLVLMGK